ncbi:PREDICTED: regenerating islet-derived protein 3-gamma-like isoform X1 [Propithecus coquereli]|uniref:C-type lectin domain-containing protein n=1 Tax=Propithecus coquereli TaxID=379532 RepID=A0A2K6F579_PROCO|nr:PREDICTED: regenerating islet-derived protein 3-gamma-like isoform X1 [Propithecus coquereli]
MLSPRALPSLAWVLLSCLVLLSQVQGEDSQKEVPSPRISCPKGSKAYASHCYALFTTPKSWMDADLACQKRPSGHLVSVLNGAEGSFVSSLVKSTVTTYSYVWIGLHDPTLGSESNGGGWEWSSTDLLNYLAWEKDPSTITNSGHCGSLSKSTGFLKWKDYNCDTKLPYVCKFKN